ncbi:MAG: NADH-quinone oxidoreductase subunit NuoK [Promethearchaeota archaeon]
MSFTIGSFTDFEVLLALSFVMLLIGIYGLTTKRSAIKVIMSLEMLVTAPEIVFIAVGFAQGTNVDPKTQTFVMITLSVGAAVMGLALAFIRKVYEHFQTTEIDVLTTLKG